ncbi:GlgB N-terminal domain-containing protein [Anaerobutyricum hallii]|jgi:1,4-alpha-glucan branching enzyme|uniref:GlgB N-terminal domain-containing protein n=1 Tax=Anaerobutyricum hallii TaxID=39488 RepID=UPI00242F1581|nr:alpha amylase C-terminal domain-containing protein [Anaerobutyricum hallii]
MRYEISEVVKKDRVMELVFGNCSKPRDLLGRHFILQGQVISAYHPDAVKMEVISEDGEHYPMDTVERQPVFSLFLPHKRPFSYQIHMTFHDGNTYISSDPYSYEGLITEEEEKLFSKGNWTEVYHKMGCHKVKLGNTEGMYFAVWAPGARRVSVVGDFNYWNGMLYPMHKMENSDIFELFIPGLSCGQFYKFEIKNVQGDIIQMVDPYAVMNEEKENGASRMFDLGRFRWEDSRWLSKRYHGNVFKTPMSVCEVRISELDSPDEKVQEIVQDMGHTHILLRGTPERAKLGVERGFFEPAFYGNTPDTMRFFVNRSHKRNIGVMLEISPEYLTRAVHLFEKKHPQAVNYLLANILFWIKEYHIDGFVFRGLSENSSDFLEKAKEVIKKEDNSVLFIGEEIKGKQTRDFFDFEWNMELKAGVEEYLGTDFEKRQGKYFCLSQPLMKGDFSNTLLLLNKEKNNLFDESLIDKKPSCDYDKLTGVRMSYGYLMGVPGRKAWDLHSHENISSQEYVKSLIRIYQEYPALYEYDPLRASFEWINGMDAESSVLRFMRKSPSGRDNLLFICNFGTEEKENCQVGVPKAGKYTMISNSDAVEFGGEGRDEHQEVQAVSECWDLRPYSIKISVPPLATLIFKF